MVVNTHMNKALRGGYTCCVSGCYSNTKRDKGFSFHKLTGDVSLTEEWVNSVRRKDFIPCVQYCLCLQHVHGAKKQGLSDVSIIFPLLPQSKQRARLIRRLYYISIASPVQTESKADQTSLLYFHCFPSPNREQG